jgi:CRISPR/Cas system CMR-associated protein Cmr5 small subunit
MIKLSNYKESNESLEKLVVGFLNSTHSRISKENKELIVNWFTRKYIRGHLAFLAGKSKNERANELFQSRYKDFFNIKENMNGESIGIFHMSDHMNEIHHIVDYLTSYSAEELSKLYKVNLDVMILNIDKWEKSFAKKPTKKLTLGPDLEKNYKIISTYGDYSLVELLTEDAFKAEGKELGNCIGSIYHSGSHRIMSIRDSNFNPHIALNVTDKKISEIRGKQNETPKPQYADICKHFVKELIENGFKVTGGAEFMGMINYNGNYYFKDSKIWQKIYTEEIIPEQKRRIKKLKETINTIINL